MYAKQVTPSMVYTYIYVRMHHSTTTYVHVYNESLSVRLRNYRTTEGYHQSVLVGQMAMTVRASSVVPVDGLNNLPLLQVLGFRGNDDN